MKINADGLDLIKKAEGLRLKAYQDSVGVWTIGYGSTSGVKPGQTLTEPEAEVLLQRDIASFELAVDKMLRVKVNENEFSALVSFAFNLGASALKNSTLLRYLNVGNRKGAAEQFLRWNRAGGKVLKGLTLRREAERALFLLPVT